MLPHKIKKMFRLYLSGFKCIPNMNPSLFDLCCSVLWCSLFKKPLAPQMSEFFFLRLFKIVFKIFVCLVVFVLLVI